MSEYKAKIKNNTITFKEAIEIAKKDQYVNLRLNETYWIWILRNNTHNTWILYLCDQKGKDTGFFSPFNFYFNPSLSFFDSIEEMAKEFAKLVKKQTNIDIEMGFED